MLLATGQHVCRDTVSFACQVHQRHFDATHTAGLARSNALDFDDLLMKAVHSLSAHQEVLAKYQQR